MSTITDAKKQDGLGGNGGVTKVMSFYCPADYA